MEVCVSVSVLQYYIAVKKCYASHIAELGRERDIDGISDKALSRMRRKEMWACVWFLTIPRIYSPLSAYNACICQAVPVSLGFYIYIFSLLFSRGYSPKKRIKQRDNSRNWLEFRVPIDKCVLF